MSEFRCATCGHALGWAWEICPECHPEGDPLPGPEEIQFNGPEFPRSGPVIRFWCGRCHSEISGPAGECRVCAASAAEVARHHRITVQERLR